MARGVTVSEGRAVRDPFLGWAISAGFAVGHFLRLKFGSELRQVQFGRQPVTCLEIIERRRTQILALVASRKS